MEIPKVFESEYRFCLILWENEPIKSSELVKLCHQKLGWKPTNHLYGAAAAGRAGCFEK